MDKASYCNHLAILNDELVAALGCTEPIAIAYVSAKAREVLGEMPQRIEVYCSGNVVKNVKGVTVPNSHGMRGIDTAATLGTVGGDASKELEVLSGVTDADVAKTRQLLQDGFCQCHLEEGVENLYIRTVAIAGEHSGSVTVREHHANITEVVKDGKVVFTSEDTAEKAARTAPDRSLIDVRSIIEFANEVNIDDVKPVLDMQITCNSALADEGLKNPYGAQVGRTLLERGAQDIATLATARAAAGSDARMGGCALPAVINSGSGNQGITVSVPVIEFAKAWNCGEEKLYRALVVSNLLSVHQKKYIGSLSAYCGAVSAACSAGAAIMYLKGGDYDAISRTIVNTLGNVGGIVCDGAKSSCASKIAAALNGAILGYEMSLRERVFQPGEGIVLEDVEETIRSMGHVGKVGMAQTDLEILNIMLGKTDLSVPPAC